MDINIEQRIIDTAHNRKDDMEEWRETIARAHYLYGYTLAEIGRLSGGLTREYVRQEIEKFRELRNENNK